MGEIVAVPSARNSELRFDGEPTSLPTPHPLTDGTPELSVVLPCRNEAETLAGCIVQARIGLHQLAIHAEIVVADNGSTDGSQAIARRLGARVVTIPEPGYGNAIRGGVAAALGEYVVMGDADGSYDFSQLRPFYDKLRDGYDLVVGNRFRGRIMPGAMPWKNRWLGNPFLTGIGRVFFRSPVGDFHSGLRAFSKKAYEALDLDATGMEFASEMIAKSALKRLKVAEVPIVLHPDGRSRPPHLRPWRDGWRHLRLMLLFCPRWLFFVPGSALLLSGLAGMMWLLPGPARVGGVGFDIHTLLVASFLCLVGYELLIFGTFSKHYGIAEGFQPRMKLPSALARLPLLEVGLLLGLTLLGAGTGWIALAVYGWEQVSFGDLDPSATMRQVIPGLLSMMLGVQTMFASFLLSLLNLRDRGAKGGSGGALV